MPFIAAAGELKTKPTQHSVKELREIGIQPDILLCRSDREIPRDMKDKIALFCNVDPGAVFTALDVKSIYEVPLAPPPGGAGRQAGRALQHLEPRPAPRRSGRPSSEKVTSPAHGLVRIGVVGKYVELQERYKSLNEALVHGGIANDVQGGERLHRLHQAGGGRPLRRWSQVDAILVPGGFGIRGTEGKILAVRYAREKKIPFFGICLGLQMAVIEFGRNVLGLDRANSLEFDEQTPHPVVTLMEEQKGVTNKGGTMRLGSYPCQLKDGTLARELYGARADPRAPPPPLRVQQRLPGPATRRPAWSSPASTRSSGWWR